MPTVCKIVLIFMVLCEYVSSSSSLCALGSKPRQGKKDGTNTIDRGKGDVESVSGRKEIRCKIIMNIEHGRRRPSVCVCVFAHTLGEIPSLLMVFTRIRNKQTNEQVKRARKKENIAFDIVLCPSNKVSAIFFSHLWKCIFLSSRLFSS